MYSFEFVAKELGVSKVTIYSKLTKEDLNLNNKLKSELKNNNFKDDIKE